MQAIAGRRPGLALEMAPARRPADRGVLLDDILNFSGSEPQPATQPARIAQSEVCVGHNFGYCPRNSTRRDAQTQGEIFHARFSADRALTDAQAAANENQRAMVTR
jgi:hypothetical protein